VLVREVVDRLATRYAVEEAEVVSAIETIEFKLPRGLETPATAPAAAA